MPDIAVSPTAIDFGQISLGANAATTVPPHNGRIFLDPSSIFNGNHLIPQLHSRASKQRPSFPIRQSSPVKALRPPSSPTVTTETVIHNNPFPPFPIPAARLQSLICQR
ncbi:MAG: hypothetical protein R3C26_00755 [Calditrichia bacterium]